MTKTIKPSETECLRQSLLVFDTYFRFFFKIKTTTIKQITVSSNSTVSAVVSSLLSFILI